MSRAVASRPGILGVCGLLLAVLEGESGSSGKERIRVAPFDALLSQAIQCAGNSGDHGDGVVQC